MYNSMLGQPAMQPVPIKAHFVARHDPHRLAGPRSLRTRRRKTCCQCRQVAPRNRVTAHLRRARHHHTELPLRFAQFKCNVNRGIFVSGGGVSVIELQHLDLRGSDESLQTNPNLLTSHHPIVSEEPAKRASRRTATSEIVPAAILRDGRAKERGLLRMRSEGLSTIVRCDWLRGIDPLDQLAIFSRKGSASL